jgi:hypothetical protein
MRAVEIPFRLSDADSPDIVLSWNPLKTSVRLVADGAELKPIRMRRFVVPLRNGGHRPVEIGSGLDLSPVLITTNGERKRLLPRLTWWETGLVFLPLVALFSGVVGGLFAAAAVVVNVHMMRRKVRPVGKITRAMMVTMAAVGVSILGALLRRG